MLAQVLISGFHLMELICGLKIMLPNQCISLVMIRGTLAVAIIIMAIKAV